MDPADEIAAWLEGVAEALPREVAAAEAESGRDLLETARLLSSGPLSAEDLERQDHPYARRHGSARRDPGVINVQSGDFQAAWTQEGPTEAESGLETAIWNEDPKAVFLDRGTRTMFGRPVADRVLAEVGPRRLGRLQEAIDRALSD